MNELEKLRSKIDKIDSKICKLLDERMLIAKEIKSTKNQTGKATKDKKREEEIIQKLDTNFKKEIYKKILKESRKIQDQI